LLDHPPHHQHAGVVYQDVDFLKPLQRLSHDASHIVGPRNVRRNSKPPPAQTLDFGKYRRNPVLRLLNYHDLGASPGQTPGNAAADSSPCPGDDCHSIGERCGKRTRFGSVSRHVAFSKTKDLLRRRQPCQPVKDRNRPDRWQFEDKPI
jgi:hypothetical protein